MRSAGMLRLMALLLGRRLPVTEGALEMPGITRPVRIARDRWGIPHIDATTEQDAWFALGFCQGQDRTFQLEMLARVVRGTVSEVVGTDAVPIDRLSRRIGFRRSAEAMEPLLDDEERTALEAFAAGVNAGRELGLNRAPHEFTLLRLRSTLFDATDSLGVGLLQAFGLASNWDSELARLTIARRDGIEAVEALDATYPEWQPVTWPPGDPAGSALDVLRDDLERFRSTVGLGGASNNWALAPSRTATGRPLLANDPHLAPILPPHWYLAQVSGPGWSIAGACFAGTPGFASAHNGHVAWGVTAGLVDNTDLFLEEIGPDGRSVRRGDEFVPVEVHREVIEVKGAAAIEETVLVTDRGPIVGPGLPGAPEAISMAATWLRPERITSLFDIKDATTFEELRHAVADWHGPSLNLVAADDAGTIGWQMIGQAPIRKTGHGVIPLPAWDPATGWEPGHVPYEDMPHAADPDTGYLATANNRPTATDDDPFLGIDWIDGYRIARIDELLAERDDWDVVSTLHMQLDQLALTWREVASVLSQVPKSATAAAVLDGWDGVLRADSPAAGLFSLFMKEMQRRIAATKAPNSIEVALGRGFSPAPLAPNSLYAFTRDGHAVRLMRDQPEGWFDDWRTEMEDALAAAEQRLRSEFDDDPAAWAWGSIRPLRLMHALGSRTPLDRIFDLGPIPWGGDFCTVSQAGALPNDPLAPPSAIASLRMAVDVGNWDASRFSLPGGQSGNPLSPHYDDQLEPWRLGIGVPMPFTAKAVTEATVETLHLVPSEAPPQGG